MMWPMQISPGQKLSLFLPFLSTSTILWLPPSHRHTRTHILMHARTYTRLRARAHTHLTVVLLTSVTQCAAVMTHLSDTSAAPQTVLSPSWMAACHGHSFTLVLCPPCTRGFLSGKRWPHPETQSIVPLALWLVITSAKFTDIALLW